MKRRVIALILLIVFGATMGAAASEENIPEKGTRQVMFGFSGWSLGNYKGGIGIRYYLREKTALRFGLDVNWIKDDDTGWDHEVYGAETSQSTNTYERSAFSLGLGAMLERHFRPASNVRPYAGLGVFGWYDRSKSDRTVYSRIIRTEERDNTRTDVNEAIGYTIEGTLLAGLQWHFAPNMSLGGEYRMSFTYSHWKRDGTETDDDRRSTDHDTRKEYGLDVDASRLWLSVAF